jgi:hypothetical protein
MVPVKVESCNKLLALETINPDVGFKRLEGPALWQKGVLKCESLLVSESPFSTEVERCAVWSVGDVPSHMTILVRSWTEFRNDMGSEE